MSTYLIVTGDRGTVGEANVLPPDDGAQYRPGSLSPGPPAATQNPCPARTQCHARRDETGEAFSGELHMSRIHVNLNMKFSSIL